MKNKIKKSFLSSLLALAAFALWTCAVSFVDVEAIGPQNSSVGLANLNGLFHSLTGVNFTFYFITDWLGLVPIAAMLFFALLGLVQLIKRKSLRAVDVSLFILAAFYIVVAAAFLFFEAFVRTYLQHELSLPELVIHQ